MRLVALLVACDLISIVAQLCLKTGAGRAIGALKSPRTAWRAFLDPWVMAGGALYAAGTVAWIRVLQQADLSFAYPFAALAYAGGVLSSQWLLRERVPLSRWAGLGLIVLGVVLVAASGAVSTGH